jgi:hypothetical protein
MIINSFVISKNLLMEIKNYNGPGEYLLEMLEDRKDRIEEKIRFEYDEACNGKIALEKFESKFRSR